ncbi:MAG: gamma carbonic anhydrase family protein [Gammaproteobacteria bacterium]|nr:MAG: gamma carbonic anhydrase family protein [Gammaproteobacteria bacterium]
MTVEKFENLTPQIEAGGYVAKSAVVIGNVSLGKDASVWPAAVIRGDIHRIEIGAGTNIQDGSVLHVTHDSRFNEGGFPLIIGKGVTVGHSVTLHGCTIGNHCLIGIGSIVLDGAILEDKVMIGAGSLVPPGKRLESGHLYVGSPVKKIRPLKEKEFEFLGYSEENYVKLKNRFLLDQEN